MSIQSTSGDGVIFRETFISPQTVAQNGGVVSGTPAINHGINLNGTTDSVSFVRRDYAVKSVVIKVTLATTSEYIVDLDGGTHFIWVNAGTVTATGFSSPTVFVDGVETTTITAGQHTICVATDTAFTAINPVIGKKDANYFEGKIRDIYWLNQALVLAEALDIYEQDTIPELGRPVIDLPLHSWYYKENGTQLVTDGDMEAVGTSAYTATACTLTKTTSSPYQGTRALRVTATGGVATPYASTGDVLTSGRRYRVTGVARSGDGVASPELSQGSYASLWVGTISTSWQAFDVEFVANNTFLRLYGSITTTVGLYSDFDDLRIELMEALTENKGSLGGTAMLGDGTTTTTFPAQLTPHGWSFDGGDRGFLSGTENLLERTDSFTFAFHIKTAPSATPHYVLSCLDAAQGYKGTEIYVNPNDSTVVLQLLGAVGALAVTVPVPATGSKIFSGTVIGTYTGTSTPAGCKIYVNGVAQTVSTVYNSLAGSVLNGRLFMVGCRNSGAGVEAPLPAGAQVRFPKIFKLALTATQAKVLHNRMMKFLNV